MTTLELAREWLKSDGTTPKGSLGATIDLFANAVIEAEEKMRSYIFRFSSCPDIHYECNENRARLIEFKEWLEKHAQEIK